MPKTCPAQGPIIEASTVTLSRGKPKTSCRSCQTDSSHAARTGHDCPCPKAVEALMLLPFVDNEIVA